MCILSWCMFKNNGIESDSQVWKSALWVEVLWHVDTQRDFSSEAVARTGGVQEHNANKSVLQMPYLLYSLAAWQHSLCEQSETLCFFYKKKP